MGDLTIKKIRENAKNETELRDGGETSQKSWNECLTYDVLRLIFKYLKWIDLSRASMVCRSWLEAANHEKVTRGPEVVQIEEYEFVFCAIRTQIVRNLRIKPALALLFTNASDICHSGGCRCELQATHCDTVMLCTFGVVINSTEQFHLEKVVCAFLPEIPNVKVETYLFGKERLRPLLSDLIQRLYAQPLKEIKQPDMDPPQGSRFFLLFCTRTGVARAKMILKGLKQRYLGEQLSIWGGVARELVVYDSVTREKKDDPHITCVGILLSGAVYTWSTIVDYTCTTKEQVERRLVCLRNRVQLKRHSMGFMFACCARGQIQYSERDVESSLFTKIFPEVPLVGCFGDGEFSESPPGGLVCTHNRMVPRKLHRLLDTDIRLNLKHLERFSSAFSRLVEKIKTDEQAEWKAEKSRVISNTEEERRARGSGKAYKR